MIRIPASNRSANLRQKGKIIFVLAFLMFSLAPLKAQEAQKCREIIGYYPSWQWYKRSQLMGPENLDYSKYTILNYSFFAPDTNGNLFGTDAWADSILLRGKVDWGISNESNYIYYPNTSVIDIAHTWGVKVMVSIGGWSLSENFPAIAANPKKRSHFASQCVHLLRSYKFDGIDIDWEYPGYAEHKGTPADKENFTLFMKEIRDSIDAYGEKINYKFLLTAAFGAAKKQMDNIEWEKITPFMDYINMMTYDINGTWSPETNHNSPLYEPAKGWGGSHDLTFKLLTETYKVPAEKINMGIAFYGRTTICESKPGLHSPHLAKEDKTTFAVDEGMPQFFNIMYQMDKFTKCWDDTAKVPYLIGKDLNTFVSYDDERSIKLKAEYVLKTNAAGVIIWDVTGDYVEKTPGSGKVSGTPLADVLNEVLQPCERKRIKKRWD